jgi:arabinose-5-phosphate isomerase
MTAPDSHADRLTRAAEVLRVEARAIGRLEELLDERFERAVDLLLAREGMVVVTGMGKAGLVGAKISATLASTGTPSLSLHPAEALHGDLGRIRSQDVVLAISNSGETAELKALVPAARKIGAAVLALTGRPDSALGRLADQVLDLGAVDEACPIGLAPTASTAAMLALGDALAMVLAAERNFSREDYARYHPAGALGRKLMRCSEVMRVGEELPLVSSGTPVTEVLLTMSRTAGRPGAALVVDGDGALCGIFTDGDLRRLLERGEAERLDQPIDEFMGRSPRRAGPDDLVEEAERILRTDIQDVLDTRL